MREHNNIAQARFKILLQEIELAAGKQDHCEDLRWKTRQLAVIVWLATFGLAIKEDLAYLCLLSSVLPLPFWYLDAKYLHFYRTLGFRLGAIQKIVRDGKFEIENGEVTRFKDFLKGGIKGNYTVPDYLAIKTINENIFCSRNKFHNSFFHKHNILLYSPMILFSVCIYVYQCI